ncbi:MAG TPA: hypothetical protein VJB66_03580 [Candidatus Nanoarchaeia archaeon]|nr:hypothetical protein [Candidatus Nanoarchaeia archaeon]
MAFEDPLPPSLIRYRGLFDWAGLYAAIADWFKHYRFILHEEMYKHKVPSPLGAEQELFWYAEEDVNEFVKFRLEVSFHLWDMTEIEVVKDGKKKLLTNARLEIKLGGKLIFDWQNRFEKTKFTRALRTLYIQYIYRRETSSIWGDMLYYRLLGLHAHIKQYLDLQTKWHAYEGYLGENR